MPKLKIKFKNLILLFLLLIVWAVVGLLGKIVSNKPGASFIKEAQAVCCPCRFVVEGCDCCSAEGCAEGVEGCACVGCESCDSACVA